MSNGLPDVTLFDVASGNHFLRYNECMSTTRMSAYERYRRFKETMESIQLRSESVIVIPESVREDQRSHLDGDLKIDLNGTRGTENT